MAFRSLFLPDGSESTTDNQPGPSPYCSVKQQLPPSPPSVKNMIFMPVTNPNDKDKPIAISDLYDWALYPTADAGAAVMTGRTPPKRDSKANGLLVSTNEQKVAVFRYGDAVYASDFKCPHAGGPLHMGEIEALPDKSLCVRCPWHGWRFSLASGKCVSDPSKPHSIRAYPVKIDYDTGRLSVGFCTINPRYFSDSTDF